MEYTEMIEKVKALAVKNREAKTEAEKLAVKEQMNALKAEDEKAFAVAVGYMVKTTQKEIEEIKMSERLGEITKMVSMAYIAKTYFNKSRSWLAQKLNGNIVNGKPSQFTDDEIKTLRFALNDMSSKLNSMSVAL